MSILASLHHTTHYQYEKPTSLGMQKVRLRPAPHTRNKIQAYSLTVSPENHFINWQQDPFGNFLACIVFPEKVKEFKIEVDLITEVRVLNPFDFFLEDSAKNYPFHYESDLKKELSPYLDLKDESPLFSALLAEIDTKEQSAIDFLVEINRKVNQLLRYTVRLEPGVQSCEETLKLKSGSCRDMAWLLCQLLRHLGLASRFVSGYLIQLAADIKSLDGPSGTEVDFTDLHAWSEVYLPGAGWVGLDPTSGLFAGEGHIPLCCTPNSSSAAPVTGTIEKDAHSTLKHDMSITRLVEAPRVTKPFSDQQWKSIDELGAFVDQSLEKNDVKLTMGGEPTFVSLDDREHDSWHFSALGKEKEVLAKTLARRLQSKFAEGGLPMYTQGKWYPGEQLPRWALPYIWRKDGENVWNDPELLADPKVPQSHKLSDAEKFLMNLSEALGIPQHYVKPLREDTPYYLWREHKLPLQDNLMDESVFEKDERLRLQKLMEENLNDAVGFVLPLHYSLRRNRWISNAWAFKSQHIILLTGDSPVGLRLPLNGLPYPSEAELEIYPERSTFDWLKDLPSHHALTTINAKRESVDDTAFKNDPNGLVRTALCTEVREGVLHVFMPLMSRVEYYLELIVAIENTAKKLKLPVVIEGYTPPSDRRMNIISVTPDPGVIEVNVHPAENWDSLKAVTQTVYEEARLSRLSTEKFLLDGKRVGTGGGNHIVLGAMTPEDSPFLRRPDLLKSMVLFWQNHPSLSYLFSGLFIGPTSQSPRIDEARHDSLYELEIAFKSISREQNVPPWQVDRLLRNLLIDLSGNTHRTEFCIDKLYSPDSDRGRLGLLELRGFEMPPHPQLSLLQSLLVRALIAAFWHKPYEENFIRWGASLHDKFMLPHYIQKDFDTVLQFLDHQGFVFERDWFQPFFSFRFPECGQTTIGTTRLTLSTALEHWPVMGEEPNGSGVSRSVDSSVERVQVKVEDFIKGRHVLLCNGQVVPLTSTEISGTFVAGIRFKAWSQPSSLHPNLPVNAPLVFDLIDLEFERSIGGCRYHVVHPGGRSYDTFPVNENEAEGRKLSRFETMGYTSGKLSYSSLNVHPEFPLTLDLRFSSK